MKTFKFWMTLIVAVLSISSFAEDGHKNHSHGKKHIHNKEDIKSSNKKGLVKSKKQTLCPVMGGEVMGDSYIDYEDKRVYFCCPGCENTFLDDPDKYLAIIKKNGEQVEIIKEKE